MMCSMCSRDEIIRCKSSCSLLVIIKFPDGNEPFPFDAAHSFFLSQFFSTSSNRLLSSLKDWISMVVETDMVC